jgi:alpha-D-xyloside xylohydrolase
MQVTTNTAGGAHAVATPGSIQRNGNVQVETLPDGGRRFSRVSDGHHLLTESAHAFGPPLPSHTLHQLNATFAVGSAELFGLGQHRQACYPSGGSQTPPLLHTFSAGSLVHIDLARGEGGAANTLPWLTSASLDSGGATFGFWLNNPAMGAVDFDATENSNRTMHWQLAAAAQLDYIITTTSPTAMAEGTTAFELLEHFVSWVGRSPGLPDWALGYWHCKNRYASQADLLAAAHGFANRSVPVDLIIIDWSEAHNHCLLARVSLHLAYMCNATVVHWKVQGDWHFDPQYWPDPSSMVKEINGLGMEVMVTVWPFSHNGSLSYDKLLANNCKRQTRFPIGSDSVARQV